MVSRLHIQSMEARFFSNRSEFRNWLQKHHGKADELWVGYYKTATGVPSITWPESVDEALCYGWIDGIRKSIDEKTYKIRFTPRRAESRWSAVNMKRFQELAKEGKVTPAGLRAFEAGKRHSEPRPNERGHVVLPASYERQLKSNRKAWQYFNAMTPTVRRLSVGWVMDAKKEETRLRRLSVLIESSENSRKVPPLIISKKSGT